MKTGDWGPPPLECSLLCLFSLYRCLLPSVPHLSKENLRLRYRALQQKSESEMIGLVAVECPAVIICVEMEYVMSKKEPAAA